MNLIKRSRLLRSFLLAAILLFPLSSCTTLPERGVKPDYTVAVLPLYNATADVDGPVLVRRVFNDKIQKYYKTKPLKDVDRILRDQMGITLGAQLDMTTPQKLAETLGVDGVIYGYLLNFDDVTTVVYNARKVRAGFKLVDAKTGQTLWARGQGVRSFVGLGEPTDYKEWEPTTIKGLQDIPGINGWHNFISIGMKPQTSKEARAAASVAVTSAVLSLGVHFVGNILNIHLISETKVMVDEIMRTMGPEVRGAAASQEAEIPRLFFPAYSVFEGQDFSALMTMTVVNQSSQESVTRKIELAKFGSSIRTNRLSDPDELSIIVKKDEKKGYILFPAQNKYIEVNLSESDFKGSGIFKETGIDKEFFGEDKLDGEPCNKYKVRIPYSDGWLQDGFIWEAKNLNGLVVRVDLNDKEARIIMELKDVSFKTPPAALFEVPEGYTNIDY